MPGDVLGSSAAATLVASAHQQRLHRRTAPHEHRADALGAVHLVGADGEQMAAESAHVEGNFARALHGINMKEGAGARAMFADFLNGLKNAGLVVRQHHADEARLGADGAQNVHRVDQAAGLGRHKGRFDAVPAIRCAASRTAECSMDVVMRWSPGCSRPKSAVLSPSVPPELKTTSASWQLKNSAIVSRARSKAVRAFCPSRWIEEALPKCSIQ